jgi:hypothetical protein
LNPIILLPDGGCLLPSGSIFANFADYRPAVTLEHSQQESCTA